MLSHPNKWFRQQVLRQFGDRKDASVIPSLLKLLNEHDGQLALEALWALNLSGGFDETVAVICLDHIDPYVRMWAIRLLGDQRKVSETIGKRLRHLAKSEPHAEVRSQLASAAKRLPPRIALPIIKELMHVDNDMDDAHIPLLIWWALEAKAESDREMVVALWEDEKLWGRRIAHGLVLERLAQRYILAGGEENLSACARLFELAPTSAASVPLITGLTEGLRGKDVQSLPSRLLAALETHTEKDKVSELTIKIRQGNEVAIDQMLTIVLDVNWNRLERLKYIQILGEINQPRVVGALLDILRNGSSSPAIRQSCLQALMSYDSDEIGSKVLSYYPDILRSDPEVKLAALNLLASRMKWTQLLMSDIEKNRLIHANDIPVQLVEQFRMHDKPELIASINRIWPENKTSTSTTKNEQIASLYKMILQKKGNNNKGRIVFQEYCGNCHKLFGEGSEVGPDLTGHERRNLQNMLLNTVDPNAEIREGYVNYLIVTNENQNLVGTIVNQSGGGIELRTFDGQVIKIPQHRIREVIPQSVSIMPERLLDPLTDEQIRDLFAFIGR